MRDGWFVDKKTGKTTQQSLSVSEDDLRENPFLNSKQKGRSFVPFMLSYLKTFARFSARGWRPKRHASCAARAWSLARRRSLRKGDIKSPRLCEKQEATVSVFLSATLN
jgi:hypothetical protein